MKRTERGGTSGFDDGFSKEKRVRGWLMSFSKLFLVYSGKRTRFA